MYYICIVCCYFVYILSTNSQKCPFDAIILVYKYSSVVWVVNVFSTLPFTHLHVCVRACVYIPNSQVLFFQSIFVSVTLSIFGCQYNNTSSNYSHVTHTLIAICRNTQEQGFLVNKHTSILFCLVLFIFCFSFNMISVRTIRVCVVSLTSSITNIRLPKR